MLITLDIDSLVARNISPTEYIICRAIALKDYGLAAKIVGVERLTPERLDLLVEKGILVKHGERYNFEDFEASSSFIQELGGPVINYEAEFDEFWTTYPSKEDSTPLRNLKSKCKDKYIQHLKNGVDHARVMRLLKKYIAIKQANKQLYEATKNEKYWMPRFQQTSAFVNNLVDKLEQLEALEEPTLALNNFGKKIL